MPAALVLLLSMAAAPADGSADAAGAEASALPSLLVLDFEADGVDPSTSRSVTDLCTTAFEETGRFEVVSGTQLREMLDLEAERAAVGCDTSDSSCLAEIAGAMGAQYIVTGRVGKLGDQMVVRISLLEPERARTVGQDTFTVEDAADLPDEVTESVDLLVKLSTGDEVARTGLETLPWLRILTLTGAGVGTFVFVAATVGVVANTGVAVSLAKTEATPGWAKEFALDWQPYLGVSMAGVGTVAAVAAASLGGVGGYLWANE